MGLKDTLHTLDIDTVLDIVGHGIGARFRDLLLERVPKELVTARINDHGGIEIQGTVEEPIDGFYATIRTGHWYEKLDPGEGVASDTYYIQVFRDPAGEKLELEFFVGRHSRSRFDFSGIDLYQYPNYQRWLGQLYVNLSAVGA